MAGISIITIRSVDSFFSEMQNYTETVHIKDHGCQRSLNSMKQRSRLSVQENYMIPKSCYIIHTFFTVMRYNSPLGLGVVC